MPRKLLNERCKGWVQWENHMNASLRMSVEAMWATRIRNENLRSQQRKILCSLDIQRKTFLAQNLRKHVAIRNELRQMAAYGQVYRQYSFTKMQNPDSEDSGILKKVKDTNKLGRNMTTVSDIKHTRADVDDTMEDIDYCDNSDDEITDRDEEQDEITPGRTTHAADRSYQDCVAEAHVTDEPETKSSRLSERKDDASEAPEAVLDGTSGPLVARDIGLSVTPGPLMATNASLDGASGPSVVSEAALDGTSGPSVAPKPCLDGTSGPSVAPIAGLDGMSGPSVDPDRCSDPTSGLSVTLDAGLNVISRPDGTPGPSVAPDAGLDVTYATEDVKSSVPNVATDDDEGVETSPVLVRPSSKAMIRSKTGYIDVVITPCDDNDSVDVVNDVTQDVPFQGSVQTEASPENRTDLEYVVATQIYEPICQNQTDEGGKMKINYVRSEAREVQQVLISTNHTDTTATILSRDPPRDLSAYPSALPVLKTTPSKPKMTAKTGRQQGYFPSLRHRNNPHPSILNKDGLIGDLKDLPSTLKSTVKSLSDLETGVLDVFIRQIPLCRQMKAHMSSMERTKSQVFPADCRNSFKLRKFMDERAGKVLDLTSPQTIRRKKVKKILDATEFPAIVQRGRTTSAIFREFESFKAARDRAASDETNQVRYSHAPLRAITDTRMITQPDKLLTFNRQKTMLS